MQETEESGSPAGNRWPRQETMALLKIRSDMSPAFEEATLKTPLWEEISRKLREEGYQRSANKCREKFENVFKYYKRTKDARAGKSYRFFSQLEAIRSTSPSFAAASETAAALAALPQPIQNTLFSITVPPPPAAAAEPIGPSSSTSSSYSGTESEGDDERKTSGKRKRKLRGSGAGGGDQAQGESAKMMAFFEGLIRKVMNRQEKMLQRFSEAIERREQNRMVREEAWRRQEKSRLSREHELAAQERVAAASREDAIISFLQILTGQKIPIPSPPQPPPTTTALAEETPTSPPPPPPPPPPPRENLQQPPKEPILSSRWPKAEIDALIKLRSGMDSRYQESIPKGPLWEEISAGMLCLGFNRSAKRCKEKWENINKYFKKVKESNKDRREDTKTCPYYHQLDALYSNKRSCAGTAGQTLSIDDHLAIISPTTPSSRQQDDRLGFFEQGSIPVFPPEDIVKKKKKMDRAIVELDSFQFRIQYFMPEELDRTTWPWSDRDLFLFFFNTFYI